MVEKPPAAEAPSDLAIMGRYVLAPDVFDRIDRADARRGRRAAAHRRHAPPARVRRVVPAASRSTSGRYDTGNKLDWLRATVEVALRHPELGKGFREALAEIVRREGIG